MLLVVAVMAALLSSLFGWQPAVSSADASVSSSTPSSGNDNNAGAGAGFCATEFPSVSRMPNDNNRAAYHYPGSTSSCSKHR